MRQNIRRRISATQTMLNNFNHSNSHYWVRKATQGFCVLSCSLKSCLSIHQNAIEIITFGMQWKIIDMKMILSWCLSAIFIISCNTSSFYQQLVQAILVTSVFRVAVTFSLPPQPVHWKIMIINRLWDEPHQLCIINWLIIPLLHNDCIPNIQ